MTELKTLKDIQNLHGFHNLKTINKDIASVMYNKVVNGGTEMAVFPSDLKQEAIKWIKEGTYMRTSMSSETKTFIKHFFDIEKEDLEDGK